MCVPGKGQHQHVLHFYDYTHTHTILYLHSQKGCNAIVMFICLFFVVDLHQTRLTHTDLKPENILFVSSDYDIYYDARKVSLGEGVLERGRQGGKHVAFSTTLSFTFSCTLYLNVSFSQCNIKSSFTMLCVNYCTHVCHYRSRTFASSSQPM